MAMVVKNNMSAVNTLNVLNRNAAALAKSLGKVSSGQKINSAADDASGYAISERMRVMVRSLDQANQNAQNGASMMKVAEGAVSSTVDILKTLKEKAINAANDSNTDSDRAAIQKELDQSIDQIDDNALITYNGKTLVDGSKMAKGVATKTSLTNQSLHETTKGTTRIVDLMNRNGINLNIQTTDTLTISYVIQGRTYTSSMQVKDNLTLTTALDNAAETFTENSPAMESAKNARDSAIATADADKAAAIAQADADYIAATTGADVTYNQAIVDANGTSVSYNSVDTTLGEALAQSAADMANASRLLGIAQTQRQAYIDANGGTAQAISDADSLFGPAITTQTAAYNNASTQNAAFQSTLDTATANAQADKDAAYAQAEADQAAAYAQAEADWSAAVESAIQTYHDSLGDIFPYDSLVESTNVVGKDAAGDTVYTANRENAITIKSMTEGLKYQISGLTFSVSDSKGQIKKSVNAVLDNFTETVRAFNKSNDNAINLQVGTKANQTIRIGLTDMRSEALGLKASTGETISVATQKNANAAVNVLDNAIQKALDQQTDIGAVQARLEMTSANLTLSSQNVQASESTIRDADMAKEMTEFTKNNVLLQAAQSMLAQANQSSSSVLSLLQ